MNQIEIETVSGLKIHVTLDDASKPYLKLLKENRIKAVRVLEEVKSVTEVEIEVRRRGFFS